MANSGPHSNGSQFYITYAACAHLDRKHTVFGQMVGGMAALEALEAVPCDKHDKPSRDIRIIRAVVLQSPVQEVDVSQLLCVWSLM